MKILDIQDFSKRQLLRKVSLKLIK